MYSVVEIAGHQYSVKVGDLLDVNKLSSMEENSSVEFDKVLFIGGDEVIVGAPTVAGAKVKAKLIRHDKDKKLVVFKRKPGLYKKTIGHRQSYSALLITEISDGKGKTVTIAPDDKNAKKYLK